ncbi:hypothetical protein L1987_78903 [Smallanthus sonchifolius]|uniref:Uncharacterized protein n=1 Tax=Smallanthus sonchifolius TaxID=185202 RepID=A0ACB8ZDY5_9ASTR|nr:hypothetical protein L1987_78903 [Smallanthus sonchifolius]
MKDQSTHLFFFLSLILLLSDCSAVDTISTNQEIQDGKTLVSDGEMFELGFFSPGKSKNRYLGIWYKKISYGTIVWVANRETPITDTSGMIKLSRNGNLQLLSGNSTEIWSSNSTVPVGSNSPVVQLLDTGNLIVWNENKNLIWQSFDYPGDTFLPGMKFGPDLVTGLQRCLTSWKSPDDPSIGEYSYIVNTNGYPQTLGWRGQVLVSRLGPWNGLGFSGFPIEKENGIYTTEFVVSEKEIYHKYSLKSSVVQRVVLRWDGKTKILHWIERIKDWIVYADSLVDTCDRFSLCGPYGICSINKHPPCGCMQGFETRNAEEWKASDWASGCIRKKPLNCGNGDGFWKIAGVKVPDTRRSWYDVNMTLGECETACKRNCSCTGYGSLDIRNGGTGCLLWFSELLDTREFDAFQDIYIRVDASELEGILFASKFGLLFGYISPEYAVHGRFSIKSDVFSFGVMVLEIINGKRNREFSHGDHRDTLLGHKSLAMIAALGYRALFSSKAASIGQHQLDGMDGQRRVGERGFNVLSAISSQREKPVSDTSGVFKVSREGNLMILSSGKTMIWSSNSTVSMRSDNPVVVVQLLDTGNLVVRDQKSANPNLIWESFDYPGNTVLPGMKFGNDFVTGLQRSLTSWKSPDDPSIGLYAYKVDTNGYPQHTRWRGQTLLSRLGPWDGFGFSGYPKDIPNSLYSVEFAFNQNETYIIYDRISSVFQRIVLTWDGKILVLHWIERTKEWIVYGDGAVDSCSEFAVCGPYGRCRINMRPPCSCMDGFKPKNIQEWGASDWSSGCEQGISLVQLMQI